MFKYVAFLWDTGSTDQLEAVRKLQIKLESRHPQWQSVLDGCGVKVFVMSPNESSCTAVRLKGNSGVVVGVIFPQLSPQDTAPVSAVQALPASECEQMVATGGRHLVDRYWGRYVAFLSDEQRNLRWVLRDPSGHLPCFKTMIRGVQVYFSYMGDCLDLGLAAFSINWDYVAARVVVPAIQSAETGLNEVTEIQPGECITRCGSACTSSWYWSPLDIARSDILEEPAVVARALRTTAKACIRTWASCYSGILLRLSGGLDSSIVLGCLRGLEGKPNITCVTYYSDSANGLADLDERRFARLAASQANTPLIEVPRNSQAPLSKMLQMGCFATPAPFFDRNVELDDVERRLARAHCATARFGGEGGDQIFYQNPVIPIVGDYIRRHGLSPLLFKTALSVAQREGIAVWRVLIESIRETVLRSKWTPFTSPEGFGDFVNPTVFEAVWGRDRFLHPLLKQASNTPHGKLWHIYMLSVPPRFYSNLAERGDPDWVEPLTSQPLLELCLRIPTFILAAHGRDRALARQAFAPDLPQEIVSRRSKGAIEGFLKTAITYNTAFVREMLLDGTLVKQRILERSPLERALKRTPERIVAPMTDIFDYIALEIWLRGWMARSRRPPALSSGSI